MCLPLPGQVFLLIVPYGIEIFAGQLRQLLYVLLIVPYGIEMCRTGRDPTDAGAF